MQNRTKLAIGDLVKYKKWRMSVSELGLVIEGPSLTKGTYTAYRCFRVKWVGGKVPAWTVESELELVQ